MATVSDSQLRDQGAAMALAADRERRRLADELHDTTIQQLVLARILLDLASGGESADRLERVKSLLDDSLAQLRSLVSELSPAVLHQAGLVAAIEWLSEQLSARWGLAYRCRVAGEPALLPDVFAETLFRSARELMTNVGRHARARTCDVLLAFDDGSVTLTVCDDGIGIGPKRTARRGNGVDGGYGLFSVCSRVEQLGGEWSLGPRDGRGTQASLRLPIPEHRSSDREGWSASVKTA
jgi:two-component system NarL family sensor kinase